jgi:hypothetical protein
VRFTTAEILHGTSYGALLNILKEKIE